MRADLVRGYAACRFGQLHYLRGGPSEGAAATLVLLHQTPSSIAEFLPFAQEMATDRQVIAFDTPGFGMSDPPPSPLSMADYAAAFADVLDGLDGLKKERVDLLGYHTGAYLAAELAIARPDLIGRVVLSGIPFRTAEERAAKLAVAGPPDRAASDDEVFASVEAHWNYTVGKRREPTTRSRAFALFVDRVRAMDRANWPYQGVWRYDAEERFGLLTQPALVIQPRDPLFPLWRTPVERLRKATVVEFPDLDHDVYDVGAHDLARTLRQWDVPCEDVETPREVIDER